MYLVPQFSSENGFGLAGAPAKIAAPIEFSQEGPDWYAGSADDSIKTTPPGTPLLLVPAGSGAAAPFVPGDNVHDLKKSMVLTVDWRLFAKTDHIAEILKKDGADTSMAEDRFVATAVRVGSDSLCHVHDIMVDVGTSQQHKLGDRGTFTFQRSSGVFEISFSGRGACLCILRAARATLLVLRKDKAHTFTPLEDGDVAVLDGNSFLKHLCRGYKIQSAVRNVTAEPVVSSQQDTCPGSDTSWHSCIDSDGNRRANDYSSAEDASDHSETSEGQHDETQPHLSLRARTKFELRPKPLQDTPDDTLETAGANSYHGDADEDPEDPEDLVSGAVERCLQRAQRSLTIGKILVDVNKRLSSSGGAGLDVDGLRGEILGRTDLFACDGHGKAMVVWLKGSEVQESNSESDDEFDYPASDAESDISCEAGTVDDEPLDPADLFGMANEELRRGHVTALLNICHPDHNDAMCDAGIPASQHELFDSFCDAALGHTGWYTERAGAPAQGDEGFNKLATQVLAANFGGQDLDMHSADPVLECSAAGCGKLRVVDPGRNFYENKGREKDRGWTCSSAGSPVADLDNPCGQLATKAAAESLQPYQKTVKFLVNPLSPVHRMLVAHRTGAGKTRTMINILENFYYDDRPKVVVLPTRAVVENFWKELLETPNKYRAYAEKQYSLDQETSHPFLSAGLPDDDKIDYMKRCFRLRRFYSARERKDAKREKWHRERGEDNDVLLPSAPLVILSYARAGGTTVEHGSLPEFKFPDGHQPDNPYDGTIVLMDEAHNLVKTLMKPALLKYDSKVQNLREWLSTASGSVVVGLTATPVSGSRNDDFSSRSESAREERGPFKEGQNKLLCYIKGRANAEKSAEGFVSFFNASPPTLFPRVTPSGVPTVVVPEVVEVELGLPMRRKYLARVKAFKRQASRAINPPKTTESLVCMPYCNMNMFFQIYAFT